MGKIKKKLKKVRIHHEGTNTLPYGGVGLVPIALVFWFAVLTKIPFWIFTVAPGTVYGIVLNFYQCPTRYFGSEDTEGIVVTPADDHIIVIEEVDENEYFYECRLMISIFTSLRNIHVNWFPAGGVAKSVQHLDGNSHKAQLPEASEENEHADTIITTPDGIDIPCRQIVGVMVRHIVTYAKPGRDCYTDEYLGFIKLGSRVDIFLPVGSKACVKTGQATAGDQTVVAKLKLNNK